MKHYLLVYRRSIGKLIHDTPREYGDAQAAAWARNDLEMLYRMDRDVEVVVLGGESLDAVKRTHSRYFYSAANLFSMAYDSLMQQDIQAARRRPRVCKNCGGHEGSAKDPCPDQMPHYWVDRGCAEENLDTSVHPLPLDSLINRGAMMAHERLEKAIEIAVRYGGTDGAHHKAWVIDQMLRVLAGESYEAVVAAARSGEDGPDSYEWDVGIPP